MSRSTIIASSRLFFTFACVALAGCAFEEASEDGVPAEYAVVASEVEDEDTTAEAERDVIAPVERYALPPKLERQKEKQGPFPQPWTPPDK